MKSRFTLQSSLSTGYGKNTPPEVFLFKYLYFDKKLITEEDFKKTCATSLKGCKFPVEFQVKLYRVYAKTVHTFLAEKKDLSFLDSLRKDYPQYAPQIELYLAHFYRQLLGQTLWQHHKQRMRLKYMDMMVSGLSMLADAGLGPSFGPSTAPKPNPEKELNQEEPRYVH